MTLGLDTSCGKWDGEHDGSINDDLNKLGYPMSSAFDPVPQFTLRKTFNLSDPLDAANRSDNTLFRCYCPSAKFVSKVLSDAAIGNC